MTDRQKYALILVILPLAAILANVAIFAALGYPLH